MLLAIDCGNTNALFAIHDGTGWRKQWRTATNTSRTADEYAVWLHQLLAMDDLSLADLDACIIATVVPQSLFHLRNLSRRYLNYEPMVIGEGDLKMSIITATDNPVEVGADRLVNSVGARTLVDGALLLVDSSRRIVSFSSMKLSKIRSPLRRCIHAGSITCFCSVASSGVSNDSVNMLRSCILVARLSEFSMPLRSSL